MNLPAARVSEVLRHGDADVLGRMPWSSNATFLVNLSLGKDEVLAIYKPQRGERPLWDFPRGTLCKREVASYEISQALGWNIVPETVLRDGPHGIGMMQQFVDHDPEEHYFTLLADHQDDFRRMAVFDVLINNTDRKGGHCLRATADGRIFGIDHGVALHAMYKLRTVIWDFAGEEVGDDECAPVRALMDDVCGGELGVRLCELIDRFELDALRARAEHLLATREFPEPDRDYHSYPWPTI